MTTLVFNGYETLLRLRLLLISVMTCKITHYFLMPLSSLHFSVTLCFSVYVDYCFLTSYDEHHAYVLCLCIALNVVHYEYVIYISRGYARSSSYGVMPYVSAISIQISCAFLEMVSYTKAAQCSLFLHLIKFLSLAASFLHSPWLRPALLAIFLCSFTSLSHHGFRLNFFAFRLSCVSVCK